MTRDIGSRFTATRKSGWAYVTISTGDFLIQRVTKAGIYYCDAIGDRTTNRGKTLPHYQTGVRFKLRDNGRLAQITTKDERPGWVEVTPDR